MEATAGNRSTAGGRAAWERWISLALVLATALAYANSLSGAFMYDDFGSIPENPTIRSLGGALSPPRTGGLTVSGRPVLNVTFALNYALGGLNPWGYHAVNLAIHAGAALLLLGLVRRMLAPAAGAGPVAATVALLWVLHPLQTEAVTYIVQRAESLMAFFYLLTLYAFVRGARAERPAGWWVLCAGACFLGMATKEVMVSAPLLVLVLDRTLFAGSLAEAWRRRRGLYLALASTWVPLVLLVLSLGGNRGGSIGVGLGLDWWRHWLTQFRSIGHYLWLTFWPHPLVFDYGAEPAPRPGEIWFQFLLVVTLLGGTVWALRRRRVEGMLGLWFFAVLAPTSLIPGPIQMTVEHRMYLALAPLLLAIVLAAQRFLGSRVLLAGMAAALPWGVLTAARNRDYRSEVAIWGDTAAKRPDNALARYNHGLALFQAGRAAEAVPEYEAAVRLKAGKNDGSEQNNLATALVQLGRHREALPHYEAALRGPKPSAEVTYNLGLALLALGETEPALMRFEEAARLKPDYIPAWNMQGATLATLGRLTDSVVRFEEALGRVGPTSDLLSNLGLTLMKLNRMPEAIARLEAAVKLRPDFAVFQSNFGIALARAGRWSEAAESFRAAIRLNPDDPDARLKLGTVLAQSGRADDAVAAFTELVQRMPGNIQGHEALGQVLSRMPGREIEAARQFAEARRLGGNP
jgi:tetratricopeptide (TPR) repeat protein